MKTKLLLLFTVISITLFSKNVVISVKSPGQGKDIGQGIKNAISLCGEGDIVSIPEGNFTLNGFITITKMISIKGAGITKTVIIRPESMSDKDLTNGEYMFTFNINNTSKSSGIVISDLTLKSKKPSLKDGDGLSLAQDMGIKMIGVLDFKIINCGFENFGAGAVYIQHDDSVVRGLITKCKFVHNFKGDDGLGLGYGVVVCGMNKKWIADPKFGSNNFIFIENNTFDYHRHAIAAGGCALYVARYNTITNNLLSQAIDAHEARLTKGTNYYATRAVEIYNNTITNATLKNGKPILKTSTAKELTETAIIIRGGEAIIHDNDVKGFRFCVGIIDYVVASNPYPIKYTIGYLSGEKYGSKHTGSDSAKGSGDLFSWKNIFTPFPGKVSSSVFYNYQQQYFTQERDYHLFPKPNYSPYQYPFK